VEVLARAPARAAAHGAARDGSHQRTAVDACGIVYARLVRSS